MNREFKQFYDKNKFEIGFCCGWALAFILILGFK